jgi:phosphatidylserine/phosphatidylglycerophosphate/cardiolipin synthase-like enzyme
MFATQQWKVPYVSRPELLAIRHFVFAILAILFLSGTARAQDHLCDPGNEDCRDILIRTIRAEQVGIDVAFWFMEDNWYADELIKKWQAGVPVRLIVDSRANGTYTKNGPILDKLRAAGIPMRERFTGGILHWKMMLFDGQDIVQFSGANYSEDAWGPLAQPLYSNYVDEAILFTGKDSITNSFRTKYDDLWLNTTYYRNYANITSPPTRRYGTFAIDPELNFAPWEPYAPRAVARYNQEQQKIDVTMYRITDRRHTDAIIAAVNRGIPVRLISEPKQYRDETRLWHAWNTDRLYMAGVQIKHRKHAGLNHQKTVILYGQQMTINGSSNWTSPSSEDQEEHNLFTTEPWMFQWFVDQFERKWNNSTGVEETEDFVPLPPAQPKSPIPSTGATAVEPTSVTLQWEGGYFAHVYDVYLGTTSNPPLIASDLPLGPSLWATHHQSLTLQTNLVPGTLYYWKVVGKTMANQTATSPVWTFTTSGTAPPPPPPVNVVRGPYLQQVTPTSAIVVWATADAGVGQVRATAGSSTVTATAATTRYAATTTGLAADYYQHEARLTGLTAATTYNYDILVGGEDANPQADTFTTAPSAGSGTVTFVAIGDSGTGSTEQRQIASLIDAQWFDLMLHGGDIAYGNSGGTGDGSYQTLNDWFFSIYRNSLRGKPVFPSVGNHDSRASNLDGKHYLDMFVLPRNGGNGSYPDHAERYYSFDYGPLHVVVLDTELAFQDLNRRAAQLAWLDADLSSTSQPWKIAVFHRSPFSAGGEHGSDLDVRAAFAPVFERQGVQAVFSAHEHTYERTKPWRVTTDPSGSPVTYIVTGGGGAPLYPSGTDTWTAVSASRHHYVRGTATLCALTVEAVGTDASVFDSVTLNRCSGSDTVDPTVSITAPAPGATVSGNVTVTANASDNVGVIRTELLVDGVSVAQDTSAPYSFTWSTTTTSNGSHDLIVRAFDAAGNDADSGTVTVTVANPTTGGDDIVLYASTATVTSGGWRREEDPSAAGGFRMRHPNGGAPKRTTALASPVDYFEVTFEAEANVPYHLWVRSKADNDDWANDSVFIQFSGATDYAIGTTSAAEMNLEDCSGCGLSGWGWQDNGWGIGVAGPHIVFTTSGPHTIRVQTREDGLSIDQIMLSPSQFLTQSPGALKNDTTIYPQSSDTTGDTQPPATAITSPTNGATVTGTTAVTATASDDVGVARVELWVDGALALTDNTSPYSFSWNTATVANGNRTLQTRAYDAAGNVGQSTSITVTVNNGPAPDTQSPATSISSPAAGATVSGTTSVAATATDNVGVTRVELWVDGALALTDNSSPYTFSWNTTTVANGNHTLQSRAYDAANNVGQSTTITVTVSNTTGGGGDDIVLYAANATRIVGAWRREADPTAAGGMLLHQPNLNAPKLTSASANPSDYFELTFTPEPNVPYHLWARIRAEDDYWPNESVYIQFSSGTPYTIGTTSATDINLENCSGCGVSGWGWQDNGWGAQVDGVNITFTTGGEKTIRVQTREDGAYIDQIILSPARFLTQAPGPLKNDATIYPESGGTTGDTQAPTTAITSPSTGATVTGTTTVTATATDNVGVTRVELWVDGALALTDNSSPYSFSWNTATVANGNHTLQSRAYDAANNVGQSTTLTVTVNNTSSGPKEIVLYAADATVIVGRWRREEDPTAAGGMLMHHPNQSAPKITSPSASPTDYFELTFTAEANVPYHLWARIKAENNDWPNESVYIQFSSGTPYTIGTTTAADINLENCSGCGVSGWGWQDNGWGAQVDGPNITFSAGGVKTIRVQTREDGTYIDQIVLSPGTYLTSAPGPLKNDNTILPKQ